MLKHLVLCCAIAGLASAAMAADFRLPAPDAAAPALAAPPPPADPATLDLARVVETDADAAASLKAEDWDLDALAATFAGSPIAAYDWVRTKTRFEPYSGILRGALGTLSARAGNAADRARLLAGLLKRMDVKVRYARATLDAATAARLVEAAFAPTSISASAPRSELLDAAALRGARDYALLRPELAAEADAAADTSLAEALAASADHVWVEAEIDGAWVALDPAASTSGETLAVASATLDELGDEMHQTVTFRVSATAIDAGVVSQIEALKVTLPATRLNGAAIFLAFVANPKEGGIGGAINKAMSGVSTYVPVLYVDGEPFVGEVVPGLVPAEGGGGINDLLGGGDETAQAELARLELTIETAAPSGAAVSATRTLLDRAPTAAAIDGTMQLSALPMAGDAPAVVAAIHNIQVTSGPVNLRNAYALRALAVTEVVMTLSDPEKVKDLSPPDLMWPVAAINQTLPIMIENAIVPAINDVSDVKAFTGRPRVTILSSGMLDVDEGGEFRFFEIDLKLSGLTVLARDGAAKAAFERRLWAGILDSAAETEFGLRQGRLALDPDTTERVSASGVSDQPLVRHDKASPGFDTTSPRTAVTAVDAGALVFAPAGAIAAWWEIDAASGAARAVLAPDLGGQRSYGGYRPEPTRTLDSSWGRQRTGLNSGRGGVVHMSEDGSRSIIQGQRGLGRPSSGGPPPNRCSGGSEYMTILGCVSLPAGWALREFYAMLLFDVVITATDIIMVMVN